MCVTTNAVGARWAVISSSRAIIYSDKEMTSPIGFLPKDKKIRVGERARGGGRVLPIVIRERIAYIKVDDISIGETLKNFKSASLRIKDVQKKESKQRIAVYYAGYASFVFLDEENPFSRETNEGELFYFNSFGLRGYLSKADSRTTWRVSIESSSTITNSNSFSIVSLIPEYSFDFIELDNYSLRAFGGLILSPFSSYGYDDLFTVNGMGAGLSAGLEMEFKFEKGLGLHVEGGYRMHKYFYELPKGPSSDKEDYSPLFSGANFSVALSYGY